MTLERSDVFHASLVVLFCYIFTLSFILWEFTLFEVLIWQKLGGNLNLGWDRHSRVRQGSVRWDRVLWGGLEQEPVTGGGRWHEAKHLPVHCGLQHGLFSSPPSLV